MKVILFDQKHLCWNHIFVTNNQQHFETNYDSSKQTKKSKTQFIPPLFNHAWLTNMGDLFRRYFCLAHEFYQDVIFPGP